MRKYRAQEGSTKKDLAPTLENSSNSYSGGTTINGAGGTLALQGASMNPTGTVTVQSGTFDISLASSNPLTIGDLSDGGANTGIIVLGGNSLITGTSTPTTTFSGTIGQLTDTGGLTKQGSGTLILSGTNLYPGETFINAGFLQLKSANAISASFGVKVTSPGTLQLTTVSSTVNNLEGSGNVDLGTSPTTLTVNLTNPTQMLTGVISNTGNLTVTGLATTELIISGANTFSGTATVSNGITLSLGSTGSFSGMPGLTVQSGGTFDASGVSPTTNITIGDLNGGSTALVLLGPNTLVTGTATTTPVFSGDISGTGGLTKVNAGTLTLNGTNSYTGPTNINGGTLTLSSTNAIATSSSVTIGSAGKLQLTTSNTINNLGGAGKVDLGANPITLTVNETTPTPTQVSSPTQETSPSQETPYLPWPESIRSQARRQFLPEPHSI